MTEQRVYIGQHSSINLKILLQEVSPVKVVIVHGKKSYESCGAKFIIDSALSDIDCQFFEFFEFSENPKEEDVHKGLSILENYHPDLIIGIGGGSVLDMAKLIRYHYSYPNVNGVNVSQKQKELLPLIVIPTTAGTGCEVTHFAVMYRGKIKYSIAHIDMLPDIAIVDPVFTYDNPPYLTACTGFDALSQAIEAYWCVNATEESDRYAIKAIELLWKNLPRVINDSLPEYRDKVSEGSYWAGKAINITKTTGPHALSYSFTSCYNIPHGHAVAYTFPFFFEYNVNLKLGVVYQNRIGKLLQLLKEIDVGDRRENILNYLKSISLPLTLPTNFDSSVILSSINMERLKNNPGISNIDKIKEGLELYFDELQNAI